MLISVRDDDPRPIYIQIASQVKDQIRSGDLKPGNELPSVRELADSLDVNLHTVHRAYQKLRDQGIIRLRLGKRASVASLRETPANAEAVEDALVGRLNELITEAFHLGLKPDDFRRLVDDLLENKGESRA